MENTVPPMEATILKEPFQPITVVLLIANGGPLGRPPFSRQSSVQSTEVNQISLRHLQGGRLTVVHMSAVGFGEARLDCLSGQQYLYDS